MQTNYKYTKEALKTLKIMVHMYECMSLSTPCYSRSDDVLESLNNAIWVLGCSICPKDILSFEDLLEWVNEQ